MKCVHRLLQVTGLNSDAGPNAEYRITGTSVSPDMNLYGSTFSNLRFEPTCLQQKIFTAYQWNYRNPTWMSHVNEWETSLMWSHTNLSPTTASKYRATPAVVLLARRTKITHLGQSLKATQVFFGGRLFTFGFLRHDFHKFDVKWVQNVLHLLLSVEELHVCSMAFFLGTLIHFPLLHSIFILHWGTHEA